jgi:enoyl-CoA hydratase/carnithine racemase
MTVETIHSEIIRHSEGRVGFITLNRPRTLNALTSAMVRKIHAALRLHEADPAVEIIVIRSSSPRAFCAGGDMREIRERVLMGQHGDAMRFFTEEYALNLAIANAAKPYVAWMDGIAMGGGLGLSVHGRFRIVTERSVLAMPETAIGFFPDVGASHFLARLPHHAGRWLGLTGARIGGAEGVALGLATHQVLSDAQGLLMAALIHGDRPVAEVIEHHSVGVDTPSRRASLVRRGAWFAGSSLEHIERVLDAQGDNSDAVALRAALRSASPHALGITLDLLSAGARLDLRACLERELEAAGRAIRHPDFIEGVRAVIVDKDHRPRWHVAPDRAVPPRRMAWRAI